MYNQNRELTARFNIRGNLVPVLREIIAEIERNPDVTYRGVHVDRIDRRGWTVMLNGSQEEERLDAGATGECPACNGLGKVEREPIYPESSRYAVCPSCKGTGCTF